MKLLSFVAFFLVLGLTLLAQSAAPSIPTPPAEHPRVFLRSSDVDSLRAKQQSSLLAPAWANLVAAAKAEKVSTASIRANAMLFLLEHDESAGRKAVSDFDRFLDGFSSDNTRTIGDGLTTGAIVYDWCYQLVPASLRHDWISHFETFAARMEVGYPPTKQGVVTGHGAESQVLRDQLSCGLAVYDEKPDMYRLSATRVLREHQPALDFVYRSRMMHPGDSYGPYRFQWDLWAAFLFRRMGAGDIFSPEQRQIPYHWLYARRPDGTYLRAGDTFEDEQHPFGQYWEHYEPNCLVASYYQDSYIQAELLRQYAGANGTGAKAAGRDPVFDILFVDPELAPRSVQDLPLSRFLGTVGDTPLAAMVARTGWTEGIDVESPDVVADMRINTYQFNGHHHLDSGAFQIYYKGALAIDSGIYRIYETDHHMNYSRRTVGHNCLLIYDPAERFEYHESTNPALFRGERVEIMNDGGQQWPNSGYEPYDLAQLQDPGKGYKRASVLAHAIGPDPIRPAYTYLKGDLTAAYGQKVRDYARSFVFLNLENSRHPAALIVYDRVVSTDPNFQKFWLLHSIEEPAIAKLQATIRRTEQTPSGKYNGQLVNTTLLPEQARVEKVGGPGREFEVFGKNHPLGQWDLLTLTDSAEPGAWRIEVSPGIPATEDHFLNVMQVMDVGTDPLPVIPVSSDAFAGGVIHDRVVLFSRTGRPVGGTVGFDVKGMGELRFLITDLEPGNWTVTGNRRFSVRVTEEGKCAYFTGPAGRYSLSRRHRDRNHARTPLSTPSPSDNFPRNSR